MNYRFFNNELIAKARNVFQRTKTCGKCLLYIGHFDIKRQYLT